MSRSLRLIFPGAWYHVMNRGAEHRKIFHGVFDREVFCKILEEVVRLYQFRLHAYSLMDNHYHLLIETPQANISRGMKHIDGLYTQYFNRKHKRDGPLMRGRFKSILIEKDSYLLELVRYIHLNSVRAQVSKRPVDDNHCSHRAYIFDEDCPLWLTTATVLSQLDSDVARARVQLDRFVQEGVPEKLAATLRGNRWPKVLGREEFQKSVMQGKCYGN